jgi:hypothetical protein
MHTPVCVHFSSFQLFDLVQVQLIWLQISNMLLIAADIRPSDLEDQAAVSE